jgi:hypothetical protein
MAGYTDWLLKYKVKGVCANKQSNGTYALCKGHSK